jgi:flagellar hook-length control protein FliK
MSVENALSAPGQGGIAGVMIVGNPADPLPGVGPNSAESSAESSIEPSVAGAAHGAVASGAFTRGASRRSDIVDTTIASTELAPAAAEPPEPSAAIAIVPDVGNDLDSPRMHTTSGAGRDGVSDGMFADNRSSHVAQQNKSAEFQTVGITQKTEEIHPPAASQSDPAQVADLTAGASAHARVAHSPSFAGPAGSAAISLVPTHVESPAWSKDFGQHVIRLAVDGQPAAEIHLNPPNLGPIRVSIDIKGQEAMLQFVAEHPQTREALENALPRLREMFAAGSLTLAGAHVSSESLSQHAGGWQGQRFDHAPGATQSGRRLAVEDAMPASIAVSRTPADRSRIDLFA